MERLSGRWMLRAGRDVVAAAGANSAPATITSSSSASSSLLGHLQRLCGGERPRRLDLGDGGGGRAHTRRMKVELIEAYVRDLTEQNELLLQIVGSLQAEADQRIADMMKNIVHSPLGSLDRLARPLWHTEPKPHGGPSYRSGCEAAFAWTVECQRRSAADTARSSEPGGRSAPQERRPCRRSWVARSRLRGTVAPACPVTHASLYTCLHCLSLSCHVYHYSSFWMSFYISFALPFSPHLVWLLLGDTSGLHLTGQLQPQLAPKSDTPGKTVSEPGGTLPLSATCCGGGRGGGGTGGKALGSRGPVWRPGTRSQNACRASSEMRIASSHVEVESRDEKARSLEDTILEPYREVAAKQADSAARVWEQPRRSTNSGACGPAAEFVRASVAASPETDSARLCSAASRHNRRSPLLGGTGRLAERQPQRRSAAQGGACSTPKNASQRLQREPPGLQEKWDMPQTERSDGRRVSAGRWARGMSWRTPRASTPSFCQVVSAGGPKVCAVSTSRRHLPRTEGRAGGGGGPEGGGGAAGGAAAATAAAEGSRGDAPRRGGLPAARRHDPAGLGAPHCTRRASKQVERPCFFLWVSKRIRNILQLRSELKVTRETLTSSPVEFAMPGKEMHQLFRQVSIPAGHDRTSPSCVVRGARGERASTRYSASWRPTVVRSHRRVGGGAAVPAVCRVL
ncbi:uncharacterized protein LOC144942114 isoform X4 [Lampetra fluviatilis]